MSFLYFSCGILYVNLCPLVDRVVCVVIKSGVPRFERLSWREYSMNHIVFCIIIATSWSLGVPIREQRIKMCFIFRKLYQLPINFPNILRCFNGAFRCISNSFSGGEAAGCSAWGQLCHHIVICVPLGPSGSLFLKKKKLSPSLCHVRGTHFSCPYPLELLDKTAVISSDFETSKGSEDFQDFQDHKRWDDELWRTIRNYNKPDSKNYEKLWWHIILSTLTNYNPLSWTIMSYDAQWCWAIITNYDVLWRTAMNYDRSKKDELWWSMAYDESWCWAMNYAATWNAMNKFELRQIKP